MTGPFELPHIIFLIISALLIVGSYFVLRNKNEKYVYITLKALACILLITIVINLIYKGYARYDNPKWYSFFPYSFCSLMSLSLSLAILFGKRNNIVLHFCCFLALYGGFTSTIYPDYLSTTPFPSVIAITGLIHHMLDIWICLLCFIFGYIKPCYKKIGAYVVGFGIQMLIGVFEIKVLKYPDAMNIYSPIISDLKILTSWYMLYIISTIITILLIFLHVNIFNKKK